MEREARKIKSLNRIKAAAVLKDYQDWRQDKNVPPKHKMPSPRLVSKAIEIAIKVMEEE